MQEAISNPRGLPVEVLLGVCRQQKASDEMLLFVKAVCGAGLMLDATTNLVCFRAILQADHLDCRSVLVTLTAPESTSTVCCCSDQQLAACVHAKRASQLSSNILGCAAADAFKPCTNDWRWPLFHLCFCRHWTLTDFLVYAVLPLATSTSNRTWYDDISSSGLVTALDVGIRVMDVSGNRLEPLCWQNETDTTTHTHAMKLLRHGVHYDLVQ